MKNVLLLFGGESYEHEISVVTASQIFNRTRIENVKLLPLYISKDNRFYFYENKQFVLKDFSSDIVKFNGKKFKEIFFVSGEKNKLFIKSVFGLKEYLIANVAINACHGGFGENGKLVAFFESFGISCSSGDFDSLAVCMNKFLFKQVLKGMNVSVVSGFKITRQDYDKESEKKFVDLKLRFMKFPVVIKPNNGGSSIGLFVAKNKQEFDEGLKSAFEFDKEVVVEKFIEGCREFNVAVLTGSGECKISEIDEPLKSNEVLTFADKYLSSESGAKGKMKCGSMDLGVRKFPADLPVEFANHMKNIALKIVKCLNLKGIVRIDFLFDESKRKVFVCELNSVPGSLAYYFFESGVLVNDLVLKLVEIAENNGNLKNTIKPDFITNILK